MAANANRHGGCYVLHADRWDYSRKYPLSLCDFPRGSTLTLHLTRVCVLGGSILHITRVRGKYPHMHNISARWPVVSLRFPPLINDTSCVSIVCLLPSCNFSLHPSLLPSTHCRLASLSEASCCSPWVRSLTCLLPIPRCPPPFPRL